MMNKMQKLVKAIKELDSKLNPVVSSEGECIFLSAENGSIHLDAYGEFTGGYQYESPRLMSLIEESGGNLEWENPGLVSVWL